MAACHALDIHQAFTSYNNPKGNADTERFMRTLKEEFAWLREWNSPTSFLKILINGLTTIMRLIYIQLLDISHPASLNSKF